MRSFEFLSLQSILFEFGGNDMYYYVDIYSKDVLFTHLSLDKIVPPFADDIFKCIYLIEKHEFRFKRHRSLSQMVQLTILQVWFR